MDAVELTGITSIMNPQHVKPDIDLNKVEDDIIGKPHADVSATLPNEDNSIQAYMASINDLTLSLGINELDADEYKSAKPADIPIAESSVGSSVAPSESIAPMGLNFGFPASEISFNTSNDDDSSSSSSSFTINDGFQAPRTVKRTEATREELELASDGTSLAGREAEEHFDSLRREFGLDLTHKPRPRSSNNNVRAVTQKEMTEEQRRRNVIHDVLGVTETGRRFDLSQERDIDTKTSKLERIEMLRLMLEDDGIDCKNIKKLDINSSMVEIDSTLNLLKMRNDHSRFSTIAEEVIQTMAQGIETVLNGQNRIPIINMTPDYTGLSATMQVKMHRLRDETSAVVEDVVRSAGLGPKARLMFELIPTLFLYPINNARQKNKRSLQRSRSAIRSSDERDKLMNM